MNDDSLSDSASEGRGEKEKRMRERDYSIKLKGCLRKKSIHIVEIGSVNHHLLKLVVGY